MADVFSIYCDAGHDRVTVARWDVPLLVQAIRDPGDDRAMWGLDGLQVLAGDALFTFGRADRPGIRTSVERELLLKAQGRIRGRVRLHCARCGLNVVREWGRVAPQIGRCLDVGVSQLPLAGIERL